MWILVMLRQRTASPPLWTLRYVSDYTIPQTPYSIDHYSILSSIRVSQKLLLVCCPDRASIRCSTQTTTTLPYCGHAAALAPLAMQIKSGFWDAKQTLMWTYERRSTTFSSVSRWIRRDWCSAKTPTAPNWTDLPPIFIAYCLSIILKLLFRL